MDQRPRDLSRVPDDEQRRHGGADLPQRGQPDRPGHAQQRILQHERGRVSEFRAQHRRASVQSDGSGRGVQPVGIERQASVPVATDHFEDPVVQPVDRRQFMEPGRVVVRGRQRRGRPGQPQTHGGAGHG